VRLIHTQGSIHFWYPPHTHLQEYFLGASPPSPHVYTHWPSLHFDFEGAVCAGTEDALCRQGGMASRGRVQQQQMPPQPWTSLRDVLPCLLLARLTAIILAERAETKSTQLKEELIAGSVDNHICG
jgi:hypothetical protein